MPAREPIEVIHRTTREGKVVPLAIVWEDECGGQRDYPIDEILDVRNAASTKLGGYGVRFHVRLRRAYRYLYYHWNEYKWYIEKIE